MITLSKRRNRRLKAKDRQGESQVSQKKSVSVKNSSFSGSAFVDKYYKWAIVIPLLIFVLAIIQIGVQTAVTGDFIHKGVSLAGGTSFLIEKDWSVNEVETVLATNLPDHDVSVRELTNAGQKVGVLIESTVAEESEREEVLSVLEGEFGALKDSEYTVEFINASLGSEFFVQTFTALIIAFVLMGLVVLVYFRTFVPSIAVILSALSDIVVTAAIVNLMGVRLSTAGIAAFLMLIGYSVDTDILLSTKMLKGKGKVFSRFMEALKTGGTMTLTTIFAVTAGLIFTESVVIEQIMMIVLIGLLIDLLNTWLLNAGILRWYVEKKGGMNDE